MPQLMTPPIVATPLPEGPTVWDDPWGDWSTWGGDAAYRVLHPTEPGQGALTPEQVRQLTVTEPSYVPGEWLANVSGTGPLDQIKKILDFVGAYGGPILIGGAILYVAGPTLVAWWKK